MFLLVKDLDFLLEQSTYPKRETEPTIMKRVYYKKDGQVLKEKMIIEY